MVERNSFATVEYIVVELDPTLYLAKGGVVIHSDHASRCLIFGECLTTVSVSLLQGLSTALVLGKLHMRVYSIDPISLILSPSRSTFKMNNHLLSHYNIRPLSWDKWCNNQHFEVGGCFIPTK